MVQTVTDFTDEERQFLLALLEARLGETRVEVHRTHTPDYRDRVKHEEGLVRGLVSKFR